MAAKRTRKAAGPPPPPAPAIDPAIALRAVQAALAVRDYRAALERVLDAWRALPVRELVPVAQAIGELAASDTHLPIAANPEERDAEWLAAAAQGDPVVRHRLITTVREPLAREAKLVRLRAVISSHDPRLSPVLQQLLLDESPRYWAKDYWLPLYAMLLECGDPNVSDMLDTMEQSWKGHVQPATAQRLAKLRAKVAIAYPAPRPSLTDETRALVEAIAAVVEQPAQATRDHETEAQLLAAIYADPADDGPRAIYADWLQEIGDPRGEYIALALAASRDGTWNDDNGRRAHELIELHEAAWLGELAPMVTSVRWDRGFPYKGYIGDDPKPSPRWATFESVDRGFPGFPEHPMPVLRDAENLDVDDFERLAALPTPPPLESVSFRWYGTLDEREHATRADRAGRALASVLPRIPTLVNLDVIEVQPIHRLPATDPWPWRNTSIRHFKTSVPVEDLGAWLVAALDSQLATFKARTELTYGWDVELARDASGAFTHLDVSNSVFYVSTDLEATFPGVVAALEQLPANSLTSIKFGMLKKAWSLPRRKRFAEFLARQTKVTNLVSGYTPPKR